MSKTGNRSVILIEDILVCTVKLSFAACTLNKDEVKVKKEDITSYRI
jgi:hypothetical protein